MFYNNTATTSASVLGFVQPFIQNTIGATATLDKYFDTPNLTAQFLTVNSQENSVCMIEGTIDVGKFLGDVNIEDDEDTLGVYNANPAKNVFLNVGVRALDDATVTGVRTVVQFVYDVEFLGLNYAGDS